MSVRDSSVTAARSRLRPILMTTLTTVCGMLPMAWGLSISTLITLVIIPVLYCGITEHLEKRRARKQAKS